MVQFCPPKNQKSGNLFMKLIPSFHQIYLGESNGDFDDGQYDPRYNDPNFEGMVFDHITYILIIGQLLYRSDNTNPRSPLLKSAIQS